MHSSTLLLTCNAEYEELGTGNTTNLTACNCGHVATFDIGFVTVGATQFIATVGFACSSGQQLVGWSCRWADGQAFRQEWKAALLCSSQQLDWQRRAAGGGGGSSWGVAAACIRLPCRAGGQHAGGRPGVHRQTWERGLEGRHAALIRRTSA